MRRRSGRPKARSLRDGYRWALDRQVLDTPGIRLVAAPLLHRGVRPAARVSVHELIARIIDRGARFPALVVRPVGALAAAGRVHDAALRLHLGDDDHEGRAVLVRVPLDRPGGRLRAVDGRIHLNLVDLRVHSYSSPLVRDRLSGLRCTAPCWPGMSRVARNVVGSTRSNVPVHWTSVSTILLGLCAGSPVRDVSRAMPTPAAFGPAWSAWILFASVRSASHIVSEAPTWISTLNVFVTPVSSWIWIEWMIANRSPCSKLIGPQASRIRLPDASFWKYSLGSNFGFIWPPFRWWRSSHIYRMTAGTGCLCGGDNPPWCQTEGRTRSAGPSPATS